MKRTKLNYRFHNPNSAEDTADFLCKLMIEVNTGKLERAVEETALCAEKGKYISGCFRKFKKKYVYEKQGEKTLLFLLKRYEMHQSEKKSHLHVDFQTEMHIIENRKRIMR